MIRNLPLGFPAVLALAASALTAGCDSPTAHEPVPLELAIVRLETTEQFETWPAKPAILGGEAIVIRGLGRSGCGTLDATAYRDGMDISIRVVTVGDYSPCPLSRWAWEPFTATIDALRPGRYHVRVAVAGHAAESHSDVDLY